APEELVLLDVNRDEEIAGGTAGGSAFAFTLHAELLACRDARRDLHLDLALARHTPCAAAGGAGLRDDPSRSAALRAGARDGEEPLLSSDLPLASALRTRRRVRTGSRPCAMTGVAAFLAGNLNRSLDTARRFLE